MQQSIRRVDPVSAMKVLAVLYAVMGLFIGAIFSLIGMIGFTAAASNPDFPRGLGLIFGVGGIIILPIFYGTLGAITGLIGAFIYNLVAQFTGGFQIELGNPEV